MRAKPVSVVLSDLVNVMGDVAFLALDPFFEADFALLGVLQGVQPNRVRERSDQAVCHSTEPTDDLKCLSRTLVEIAKRGRPFLGVKLRNRNSRFCNQVAAAHIGAGLAIGQMNDNFVDTPATRRWLVEPHLFRELAQNDGKQYGRPAK